jgi:5-methylcytosine-specific restriction protein B
MAIAANGAGFLSLSETEWDLRARRYQQLRSQVSEGLDDAIEEVRAERAATRSVVDDILDRFAATRSGEDLKSELDSWGKTTRRWGFSGPNGQMFLNQLINDSDPTTITDLLTRCFVPPTDPDDAVSKFEALDSHVEFLRNSGSSAQRGRVASFLTWFWWLQQPDDWPVLWASAWTALARLGFITSRSHWSVYFGYRAHVQRFGPLSEVEQVLGRVENTGSFGLDITTFERLEFVGANYKRAETDTANFEQAQAHLELIREMSKPLGTAVRDELQGVFGTKVKLGRPSIWWNSKANHLRRNLYVSWTPDTELPSPSLLLVADGEQVQVGLQSSSLRSGHKGLLRRTFDLLEHEAPDGTEWTMMAGSVNDPDRPLKEIPAWALLGRSFAINDFATHEQAAEHILGTAQALMPAFEKVWANEAKLATPADPADPPVQPATSADDQSVNSLKQQFLQEEHYPNERDRRDRQAQREWAPLLQKQNIASTPLAELRRMYNGSSYGSPGPQSILNTTLSDEDPDTVDRFRRAIEFLLWGPGDTALRIDAVMDEEQFGLRGFKEGAIMKFLAIAHPDQFLAVYPFSGALGKAAMLQAFGLDVPAMTSNLGSRQVEASGALKSIVAPLFPDDAWGQSRFLYWLGNRAKEADFSLNELDSDVDADPVGTAAEELLLDRVFLDEVHELLAEHRQVIFYGPPGTGKTYVAQRLAEAIAPTGEQRMLIQFHPSTSYEDFFEGYRPIPTGNDQIIYKLVAGPLRIMAERAAQDLSKRPHVLIIDEINRANLAKVLGELLFLLEYRDREIQPLYRPTDPFSLPENLWIIGTMNTADRSIATVDAAMRRRFHFVPFIPDDRADNPISGLLARWLDENSEPTEVADLVDGVNQWLRKEMGGDHLLIGPSYFMTGGLDRAKLARIWKYRIEPLIDDLFFGDERAKKFRFDRVWSEFGFGAPENESPDEDPPEVPTAE